MSGEKYIGLLELISQLDGLDNILKKKGLTEEKIFCRKLHIFMSVLASDCESDRDIQDKLLEFFENHELWDAVIRVSECMCDDKKCQCRRQRDIFIRTLEKDAKMRKI